MSRFQSARSQAGIYNSVLPTIPDGVSAGLAVDSSGRLIVSPVSGGSNVNIADINSVTPLMGNGLTGTGSLRVTVASDNTAFAVTGNKTNNNAVPGATNFGALTALANAAVPSWTEGNEVLASVDLSGNQRITLGTLLAGEDLTNNVIKVEERFSYLNIAAGQATTVVKAAAGFLHTITLNSAATATNTTIIYDNASGAGTVIGRPAATTATVPTTLTYDVSFTLGLTIITATANGSDMTISYR